MRKKKGIITSTKMTGTVAVTCHRFVLHAKYGKRFRVSKKFLADTAGMTLHEGDEVVIGECAPLSKHKHFKVMEITKKAPQVSQLADEAAVAKALNRGKEGIEGNEASESQSLQSLPSLQSSSKK